MEGLQLTREKLGLTCSSASNKRFTIALVIALPLILAVTLLYQNYSAFGRFPDFEVPRGGSVAVADERPSSGRNSQNSTDHEVVGGKAQNSTSDLVGHDYEAQNSTDKTLNLTQFQNSTDLIAIGGKAQNSASDLLGHEAQNSTDKTLNLTQSSYTGSETDSSLAVVDAKNEKLVGGLLSSSFDESTCLSRYQSYLLRRKASTHNHKPSPYLIDKLRNYEELHRKCGPHTTPYNRTMRRIIKSKTIRSSTMCKYIVWTPDNGLGNRMINIVSTFLYAVLTERVLLVDFEADMDGLFCEPFPNSTWLLPDDFPHKHQFSNLPNFDALFKQSQANSTIESSPSLLFLDLQHGHNDQNRVFHCNHAQQILQKSPVVVLRSDQYFAPALFMISAFTDELSKMFTEKETVFHHIGRYLFHPSDETWGLITRFHEAYLARADEIIGLQIRVFAKDAKIEYVMDRVLGCTVDNKILPELEKEKSVTSPIRNQTLKAVLITSLKPDYSEKLRSVYSLKPTVNGDIVGVFQPSHEQEQKFYNSNHNVKAWADMYLLSLSDVLVTSGWSTFGYVAAGLGGLKPWIMQKLDNAYKDPPCVQSISMEPCFHFPPKLNCITKKPPSGYSCSADTSFDIKSMFPFMKSCEDLCFGVKMV